MALRKNLMDATTLEPTNQHMWYVTKKTTKKLLNFNIPENAVLRKWRQENSERRGVKKRGRPSEARFLALDLTPLFLDISSAVLLRRTEPFSFATFLFGSGKRKVEKIDKKVKEKIFCTPSTNPKSGDFLGLGSQVHRTYSYFLLWQKKS